MTIIEYAEKLGIELNSAEITILNEYEKGNNVIVTYPRMMGRTMLQALISEAKGYNRAITDLIESDKNGELCQPIALDIYERGIVKGKGDEQQRIEKALYDNGFIWTEHAKEVWEQIKEQSNE